MKRRQFFKIATAGVASYAAQPMLHMAGMAAFAAAPSAGAGKPLEVVERTIEVNRKAAKVFGLRGPDGKAGLRLRAGQAFDVSLFNRTAESTIVHWHGLTPPWPSDGVQDAPMPLIPSGGERSFNFAVDQPGTYWMHAHTPQQQQLLTAPLIVEGPDTSADEQEVVVLLNDFSFKSPGELLAGLMTKGGMPPAQGQAGGMGAGSMDMGGMDMGGSSSSSGSAQPPAAGDGAMAMDINDIDYDAYLANDRTLDDPEIVPVERGGRIRLRIINGSAATAYTLDLGELQGTLIAVDGQAVAPVTGSRFPLSMGQRIDMRLRLPATARAFPILALREGARERTGIVLQPKGASVTRLAGLVDIAGPILDLTLEAALRATAPLASRKPDKVFDMALTGDMSTYRWGLETKPTLVVDKGDRVEITFRNASMMAHPMHLHGHQFQVVAIDWKRIPGAMRDTVLVPPLHAVTIAVDAINPGRWAFHCHHLYHMENGMMTTFSYRA
jgi:FtsP/CotA-like multicopper oxidase with cupredoxin domain